MIADAGDVAAAAMDDAALERLRGFGGGKLLREMIGLFLVAAPSRIAAARTAVGAGDAPAVEMALHSLKSSAAQLGAVRMQQLSAHGETSARAGDLRLVGPLVEDLELEWTRVREWLTGVRDGAAS